MLRRRGHRSRRAVAAGAVVVAGAAAALLYLRQRPPPPAAVDAPQATVEVEAVPLRRGTVRARVGAYGVVRPRPADSDQPAASAAVASAVEGVLAAVACTEGQVVRAGQVLFVLDTRTADAAVARAESALVYARRTLARRRVLIGLDATSEQLLQDAEGAVAAAEADLRAARTARELLTVRAPLSGTVVRVAVRVGEAVRRDTVLAQILDTARLVATMQLPLAAAGAVRVGQPATIHAERVGAAAADGIDTRVVYVGAQADARTGTVPVRVTVPSTAALLPGSLVDVEIVTDVRDGVFVVPVEGLIQQDGGAAIVRVDGGVAHRLPVRVGVVDGGRAEIAAEGLREGMTVVTVGAYGLPEGTPVSIRRPAAR